MPEKDLTQLNAEEEKAKLENQEKVVEPVIDWEADDNPYKKRYGDSQSQVTPLVNTLQQFAEYDHDTKTWKPKATPASPEVKVDEDFEKTLETYDPEFKKAIGGYVNKRVKDAIGEFRQESVFLNEYNSGVTNARSKALEEFGDEYEYAKNGKFNNASPLYKLANEILTEEYAQFNPDRTFHKYTTPDAEYLSTVKAYAILSKRSKQPPTEKGKMGAIQGKGTKSGAGKGTLTYEEYSKLSDADKDAYDLSQQGG